MPKTDGKPQSPSSKNLYRRIRGASLTSYGLVVGLIAVLAIIAVQGVGDNIRILFTNVGNKMQDVASGTNSSGASSSNQAPALPSLSNNNIQENNIAGAIIGTISAIDPDGDTVTFSLASGGDNAFFQIGGGSSNELQAINPFNFEIPQDGNLQNDYDITLIATDNGSPIANSQANFTITITDDAGESAWDLATATYDGIGASFDLTGQSTFPSEIFFKPDGTKLYMLNGNSPEAFYQYSLSTAWDVSTATLDAGTLTITEDNQPRGMFFKPDGTKLYISGTENDNIYQYSLSTPWVITSGVSYDSASFNSGAQATTPIDFFFRADGLKMYTIGFHNQEVYQYSLTTPWDLTSGVTYDSISFDASSQAANLRDVFFKPDGTRMYIVANNDRTYQYDLSTPWNVSTAAYNSVNLIGQDSSPTDMFFSPDGEKLFITGFNASILSRYSVN